MAGKPDPLTGMIASGSTPGGYVERTEVNVRTQVVIQVLQMAGIVVLAVPAIAGGLWLLGRSVVWALAETGRDWERLWVAAAAGAVWLVARGVLRALGRRVSDAGPGWRLVVEVIGATAMVLLALSVVEALVENWDWPDWAGLVGGLGMIPAGVLLLWRFSWELYNPAWPESPVVRLWREWLLRQEPEAVRVVTPYPVRMNGETRAVDVAAARVEDSEEDMGPAEVISPEFEDMVGMLELALVDGLSRSALVTTPRHIMDSGQRLTVPYLIRLLDLAEDPWRVIVQHGKGTTPTWVDEEEGTRRARVAMLRQIVEQFGQ